MKMAIMCLAHKNFEQIEYLIQALHHNSVDVYIHVDQKNDGLYSQLMDKYEHSKKIYIINRRISVNRGGLSVVEAILALMKEVVQRNYDYVSLISGQCFPIQSMEYIINFLELNKGNEYIEGGVIGPNFWRLKCFNFFSENKNNRKMAIRVLDNICRRPQKVLIRRKTFKGLGLYKGSTWFTITYDCLKYMVDYIDQNPIYLRDYRFSYCPDESFFHILVMNSEYKSKVINNDLMEIDWINQIQGSPRVYNVNDYEMLKSSPKLFARKFDIEQDKEIVLQLMSSMNHEEEEEYKILSL